MQEWECPKCGHTNDGKKCECDYKLPFYARIFLKMSPIEGLIIASSAGTIVGCLLYVLVIYIKA